MLKLIAALLVLILVAVAGIGYTAVLSQQQADRYYRASRIYIVAADSLETRLRWAEGRYSQCAAYSF